MKQLVEFLNESQRQEFVSIFESVVSDDREITLQECYEELFDKMFSVNEGFFSSLGKKLASWGEKAAQAGENLDKKISDASDAAKKAIENAKEKAGEAWGKVKNVYSSVVLSVDDAIKASKESIVKLCEQTKMKIEDFEGKCAQIYANAIANSKDAAKALQEWVADKTNGARKFAAMNTLLMGAVMAKGAGIDSTLALDVLSMAGFK